MIDRRALLRIFPALTFVAAGCGSSSGGDPLADTTATATATATGTATASGTDDATTAASTGASEEGDLLDIGTSGDPTAEGTGGATGCQNVDLLFVIDDSGSMSDNQDKLTAAFPGMADTIDSTLVAQQDIDYRIGVISSNILDETACLLGCGPGFLGRLLHEPARVSCSDMPAGRWIEGSAGATAVANQFTCIASLNMAVDLNGFPEGSSEAPMEATRLAFNERMTDAEAYNLGFLRDDALLVLILVTDEDDGSSWMGLNSWGPLAGPGPLGAVPDYYDMIVAQKGGYPENVAIVAISGPQSGGGETDAPRIHQLLALAEPNAYWTDISGNDYSSALQEALAVIEGSCDGFIPPG